MAEPKRLLVLVVDVDNDLHEKAKVRGPVVGRQANIDAATKLAIADPEDSDANTIFEAVKKYDELRKEYQVEVATVTGDVRLGYHADREIVKQLEKIISDFSPEACIFVSDGASDEQVLPLVHARVKVNSVKTVTIKQAKELEKTYFTILEKLKDPHYARLIFGLPGLALLLWAFSEVLGLKLFIGLLGAYLIIKALGIEERFFKGASGFRLSFDKLGFIFYFAAIPLAAISLWLGVSRASAMEAAGVANVAKLAAGFVKDVLLLLPVALLLIILGQVIEAINEKKKYLLPHYVISSSAVVLLWLILNNAADWVLGTVSFSDFFTTLVLVMVVMVLVIYLARAFKGSMVSKLRLEGKEVYTEIGSMLGKIVGVNKRRETIIIQTSAGQKIDLTFDHIVNAGEKVIIRY